MVVRGFDSPLSPQHQNDRWGYKHEISRIEKHGWSSVIGVSRRDRSDSGRESIVTCGRVYANGGRFVECGSFLFGLPPESSSGR